MSSMKLTGLVYSSTKTSYVEYYSFNNIKSNIKVCNI